MYKINPCPFCGGPARIVRRDNEGNEHPAEYYDEPWSGVQYHIEHTDADAPAGDCPIALPEGETIGMYSWDDAEEAADAWNTRKKEAHHA